MTNHGHQAHMIHGHTGAHTLPRPHILSRLTTDRRSMRTGSPLPGPELRTTRYRAARSHDLQTVLLRDRLALPRQHFPRVSPCHFHSIPFQPAQRTALVFFSSFFPLSFNPTIFVFPRRNFHFQVQNRASSVGIGGGGGGNLCLACMERGGINGKRVVAVSISTPRTTTRAITRPAQEYTRRSWDDEERGLLPRLWILFCLFAGACKEFSGQFGDVRPGCQRAGLGKRREDGRGRPMRCKGTNIHCRTE